MVNICKHIHNLNGVVKHKRHDAGLEAPYLPGMVQTKNGRVSDGPW
jgi:hypothetical protein